MHREKQSQRVKSFGQACRASSQKNMTDLLYERALGPSASLCLNFLIHIVELVQTCLTCPRTLTR